MDKFIEFWVNLSVDELCHEQACTCHALFLSAFAKLRKATSSVVMGVRPSFCLPLSMEHLGSHRTEFGEIWCLSVVFRKSVKITGVSFKYKKHNRNVALIRFYIYDNISQSFHSCLNLPIHIQVYTFFTTNLAEFFLEWETFYTKVVERIKTHILHLATFFP